jgi:hypothetical protein
MKSFALRGKLHEKLREKFHERTFALLFAQLFMKFLVQLHEELRTMYFAERAAAAARRP